MKILQGDTKPKAEQKHLYQLNTIIPAITSNVFSPTKIDAKYTWTLYRFVNNKWQQVKKNIKYGEKNEYLFGQGVVGIPFKIMIHSEEKNIFNINETKLVAELTVVPKTAKEPVIGRVILLNKNNSDVNKAKFNESLTAQARTSNLLGKDITFYLWEEGTSEFEKYKKPKKGTVNKHGIAEVQFNLSEYASPQTWMTFFQPNSNATKKFYVSAVYEDKKATNKTPVTATNGQPQTPRTEQPSNPPPTNNQPQNQNQGSGILSATREVIAEGLGSIFNAVENAVSPAQVNQQPQPEKKKDNECICFCDRKISPDELKEMVVAMRKATYDDAGENFYKWNKDNLFTGGHEVFVDKTYSVFAEVLNKTFDRYEINSCIRKIHFLAQCYHETGAFMRSVEGSSKDNFWYDPYRGRGFIHLTLKGNYQKFKDDSGFDVVNNPKLVSTNIEIAAKSSGWYWKYNDKGDINPFADKDSIFDTSRLVNKPNATKTSTINGYNQRVNATNALKTVFEYPQNCCNKKKKETTNENTICPSGLNDCICSNVFTVEEGFINNSVVTKNHVNVIEHGNYKDPKTSVQKIILHRTAGGTTEACINAFRNGRKNKKGGIDHYGTHFVVGKDGIITQTANLKKVTWHCAGWNSKSVGIEVVGFAIDANGKPTLGLKGQNPVAGWENLTDVQAKSVACLVKALLNYYSLDKSKIDCH